MAGIRDLGRGLRNFWNDPAGRAVAGLAATVIATATVFYRFVEDMRWIDALYCSGITVSTVGYGDISPTTVPGKIFTMVDIVVGTVVLVALVSITAHHVIEAEHERQQDGAAWQTLLGSVRPVHAGS